MNNTTLVGRLVRDVELKQTGADTSVTNFTVAVQRAFKNAQGEYESDFIDCVAWRGTADFMSKYFKKGDPIALSGSIQTRNYENSEGRKVYVTEVVAENVSFVPQPPKNQQAQQKPADANPFQGVTTDTNPFDQQSQVNDIPDSSLPF